MNTNMKMIYSYEELSKLSPKEMLDLTSFGEQGKYSYSQISYFDFEGESTVVIFTDGTKVSTEDRLTSETIVQGKSRYDMLKYTLSTVEDSKIREQEFYRNINKNVDILYNRINAENTKKMNAIKRNIEDNFKTLSEDILDPMRRIIYELDTNKFNDNMKKVDKIVSAFDSLLD